MARLHRPVVALLAGDDRAAVPTTQPRHRDRLPERRCANSACRCVLARDNPERFCSPCQRRVSQMPAAIHDFLNDH